MSRFYLLLWLHWVVRLTLCSVLLASATSCVVTIFIYFSQGMPPLGGEILTALFDIFKFWFQIFWSLALLVALFRTLKYIFNTPHAGYELKLMACGSSEVLQNIGYGDLVKVWRKWFMLLVWLSGAIMILALAFTYFFTSFDGVFEWFSIYWLFGFILIAGYFSFILLGARCKKVKVVKC
ncbi:MAG: hypothetical protein U9Q29_04265 [Campylobacterota bacterium]|nr:hypothetical protein [Campylobacterota bacterium]